MAVSRDLTFEQVMDQIGNPELNEPGQYHNAALTTRRMLGTRYALALAERGVRQYPQDIDLVADCLSMAPIDSNYPGDEDSYAEHYFKRLAKMDRLC